MGVQFGGFFMSNNVFMFSLAGLLCAWLGIAFQIVRGDSRLLLGLVWIGHYIPERDFKQKNFF